MYVLAHNLWALQSQIPHLTYICVLTTETDEQFYKCGPWGLNKIKGCLKRHLLFCILKHLFREIVTLIFFSTIQCMFPKYWHISLSLSWLKIRRQGGEWLYNEQIYVIIIEEAFWPLLFKWPINHIQMNSTYLPHTDSPLVVPVRTYPPWTEKGAGPPSGMCCETKQCSSCRGAGPCPGTLRGAKG